MMEWKDVGKFVGKFAPLLGTALGGPAVGGAVGLLCSTFDIDGDDATPENVMSAIQSHPELVVTLRKIEADNRVALADIALKHDQLSRLDTQSARAADVEKTKATGRRDYALYSLAALITVGFFSLTGVLCFVALPEGSTQAVFLLFGSLAGAFGSVVGYFFGTSKSSSEKTELLVRGNSAPTTTTTPPTR
jgi:hypothetical protein